MSGSPGSSSAGSTGGRSPRNDNADVTERHDRGGGRHAGGTDASTSARGTQTGERDSSTPDPDRADENAQDDG